MDRRRFLAHGAAATGVIAASQNGVMQALAKPEAATTSLDLTRHRFGVNYTPSHNWWYCWNDWDADPIKRDLDALVTVFTGGLSAFFFMPPFPPPPQAGGTISAACFFNSSRRWGASHAPEAIVQEILKMWGD